MKFLIAASFVCLALFGQTEGGSLRGLTVLNPNLIYRAPLIDNREYIDGVNSILAPKETTIFFEKREKPIISIQSVEYGAPQVVGLPVTDSLPLVNTAVEFGIPAKTYGPPATVNESSKQIEIITTTIKPEIPMNPMEPELPKQKIEPGLPALPSAPIVIIEEMKEVPKEYLPPNKEEPTTVAPVIVANIEEVKPEPEIPSTTPEPIKEMKEEKKGYTYEAPKIKFELPLVNPVPAPSPVLIEEQLKPELFYGTPGLIHEQVHLPAPETFVHKHVLDVPQTTEHLVYQPTLPIISELALSELKSGYLYRAPTKDFPTPLTVPLIHDPHANKVVIPGHVHAIRPSTEAIIVEDFKTSEAINSGKICRELEGVSFINHKLPTPIAVPHSTYGAPAF